MNTNNVYMHKSSPSLYLRVQNSCWGAFVAGYTISELGIAYSYLSAIYKTDSSNQRTLGTIVVTVLSASALVSAYLSQFAMKKIERRTFMMIADLIFILASGLTQITTWWVFFVARMVMGISVGMNTSVISLYIREISPDNMTGKTGALFQANVNLGIIFGFIMNLPLQEENVTANTAGNMWRLVFLFPAGLCLLRTIMFLTIYRIDTPYYYYRNRMNENGRKAVEEIFQEKFVLNIERGLLAPGSVDFSDSQVLDQTQNSDEQNSYKNRLKVGMAINFLQQMCGNTFLAVYSTSVLGTIASDFDTMRCFVLGSYIFLFFVSTLGVSFNRKLARKRYLVGGFFFCGLMQLALAAVSVAGNDALSTNINNRFLFVLSLFAFYAAYNFSIGPVTSIFTSDILKDQGMSYSIVMNWLGNTISLLLNLHTHLYINYLVFACCGLLGFICSLKFVVETRYKNFQDIQLTYQHPENEMKISQGKEQFLGNQTNQSVVSELSVV